MKQYLIQRNYYSVTEHDALKSTLRIEPEEALSGKRFQVSPILTNAVKKKKTKVIPQKWKNASLNALTTLWPNMTHWHQPSG